MGATPGNPRYGRLAGRSREMPGWYVAAVDSPAVTSAFRPRRTIMSVPGSSERFIAKARDVAVDEVMLDLEDSVAPSAKDEARDLVAGALAAGGWMAGSWPSGSTARRRSGPTGT